MFGTTNSVSNTVNAHDALISGGILILSVNVLISGVSLCLVLTMNVVISGGILMFSMHKICSGPQTVSVLQ